MNTLSFSQKCRLSISVISCALLVACASGPIYKPAQNNGYGYQESVLSSDRVRVSFKSRSDNKLLAFDLALLRAAELTKQQGYDWFIVVSKETLNDQHDHYRRSSVSTGVSTGYGGMRSGTSLGLGLHFGDEKQELESIIEVKMGKGIRPENVDSYVTDEIINNVKRQYKIEQPESK